MVGASIDRGDASHYNFVFAAVKLGKTARNVRDTAFVEDQGFLSIDVASTHWVKVVGDIVLFELFLAKLT